MSWIDERLHTLRSMQATSASQDAVLGIVRSIGSEYLSEINLLEALKSARAALEMCDSYVTHDPHYDYRNVQEAMEKIDSLGK